LTSGRFIDGDGVGLGPGIGSGTSAASPKVPDCHGGVNGFTGSTIGPDGGTVDAIAVATYHSAEIRGIFDVIGHIIESEYDIFHDFVFIGHNDFGNDGAVIHDVNLHALGIFQYVKGDGFVGLRLAKWFFRKKHVGSERFRLRITAKKSASENG
jgi:hypothetical protein